MLDLFAHPQSRVAFQSETEEMAADDGVDDAVVSARKLLADEPIAILYCIDGSFVRASPSILKTTNGSDDTAARTARCSYVSHHLESLCDEASSTRHL